jgi:hypothetical protein
MNDWMDEWMDDDLTLVNEINVSGRPSCGKAPPYHLSHSSFIWAATGAMAISWGVTGSCLCCGTEDALCR